MGSGQAVGASRVFVNLKLLRAVKHVKIRETTERYFAGARHELQEACPVFLLKWAQRPPEPLNLGRELLSVFFQMKKKAYKWTDLHWAAGILVIFRVCHQIVNIDIWKATDQQLELLLVKNWDQTFRYDIVESFKKSVQLLSDGTSHFLLT